MPAPGKDVYWSFSNEVNQLQADGLTFDQAVFVYALILEKDRENWLVWREGLSSWQELQEFREFEERDGEAPRRRPPLPPQRRPQDDGEIIIGEVREQMIIDNRLTRRFLKNFSVEIFGTSASFRTTTINVSLGGMRLKDPLPAIVGTKFNVMIRRKSGAELKVFCSLLRPSKGQDDVINDRIRILGAEKEGILRNWLIDSELE